MILPTTKLIMKSVSHSAKSKRRMVLKTLLLFTSENTVRDPPLEAILLNNGPFDFCSLKNCTLCYTMPDIFEQESGNEIVTRNSPAHVTNHSTALVVWLTCVKLQAVTT